MSTTVPLSGANESGSGSGNSGSSKTTPKLLSKLSLKSKKTFENAKNKIQRKVSSKKINASLHRERKKTKKLDFSILLLGLDGAGKTAIMNVLRFGAVLLH